MFNTLRKTQLVLYMIAVLNTGCKKVVTSPVCTPTFVSISSEFSDPCIAQGAIHVLSPLGSQISYSINNVVYQPSPVFNALLPGNYTISAKDAEGCISNASGTVSTKTAGALFGAVKSMLFNNCFSCHGGTNPQAGLDWSVDCNIVSKWDRIKARAVDGDPSPMPQAGLMPQTERNKILNWINAGHRFTD